MTDKEREFLQVAREQCGGKDKCLKCQFKTEQDGCEVCDRVLNDLNNLLRKEFEKWGIKESEVRNGDI